MTILEKKSQLRTEVRTAERQLSEKYRRLSNQAIAAHLLALPNYLSAGTVFCFVSTPREIDTHPVLEDVLRRGKCLCVPLCVEKGRMELRAVTSLAQLHPGAYGILEPDVTCPRVDPDAVDFAVIPCVSCDRSGRRLGQGGGYYDRFLSSYRAPAVLICQERLLRGEIPTEPHDCAIPWVITERGLYEDGIPARIE